MKRLMIWTLLIVAVSVSACATERGERREREEERSSPGYMRPGY